MRVTVSWKLVTFLYILCYVLLCIIMCYVLRVMCYVLCVVMCCYVLLCVVMCCYVLCVTCYVLSCVMCYVLCITHCFFNFYLEDLFLILFIFVEYLLNSLAGQTLFSLVYHLLCLPPSSLINFVNNGFMDLFVALNKLNTISPAYDVMEMQEMKWPFAGSGEFFCFY